MLGCTLDQAGQQAPALDLFAEAQRLFDQAGPSDDANGLNERFLGLALYFLGRARKRPDLLEQAWTLCTPPSIGETPPSRPTCISVWSSNSEETSNRPRHGRRKRRSGAASPTLNKTLGEVLKAQGRTKEAIEAYQRAAEGLMETQRFSEAVEVLRAALRIDPTLAWAQLELGGALRLLGRHAEALEALDRAIEHAPDDPVVLTTRGRVLRALGRREEAVEAIRAALEALDRAIRREPDNACALGIRGRVLRALGRREEAVERSARPCGSTPRWPGRSSSWVRRCACWSGTPRPWRRWTGPLSSSPTTSTPWGPAARCSAPWAGGRRSWRRCSAALRIDPTLAWAQLELGEALRLLERHAEALEALDRAIELEPDNAYALGTRGQVLRALGRREEAVEASARPCGSTPRWPGRSSSWVRRCACWGGTPRPWRRWTEPSSSSPTTLMPWGSAAECSAPWAGGGGRGGVRGPADRPHAGLGAARAG